MRLGLNLLSLVEPLGNNELRRPPPRLAFALPLPSPPPHSLPNLSPLQPPSGAGFLTQGSSVSLPLGEPRSPSRQLRIASRLILLNTDTAPMSSLWKGLTWAHPSKWSLWGISPLPPGMSVSVFFFHRRMNTRRTGSSLPLILLEWRPSSSSIQIEMGCSKRERVALTVCSILSERIALPFLFTRKAEGILSVDFKELARLSVTRDTVTFSWNIRKCEEKNIDFESIGVSFLEEENIQWSSSPQHFSESHVFPSLHGAWGQIYMCCLEWRGCYP